MLARSSLSEAMLAETLTDYLHHEIPISAAMHVSVAAIEPETIRLRLPLHANSNHKGTVFGGSLASGATLAAWSLLHVRLGEEALPATVVIQANQVSYLQPAEGDCVALASNPDPASWERFLRTLKKHRRARITLKAQVLYLEQVVVEFSGDFVAIV